jgi:hypothetical protein
VAMNVTVQPHSPNILSSSPPTMSHVITKPQSPRAHTVVVAKTAPSPSTTQSTTTASSSSHLVPFPQGPQELGFNNNQPALRAHIITKPSSSTSPEPEVNQSSSHKNNNNSSNNPPLRAHIVAKPSSSAAAAAASENESLSPKKTALELQQAQIREALQARRQQQQQQQGSSSQQQPDSPSEILPQQLKIREAIEARRQLALNSQALNNTSSSRDDDPPPPSYDSVVSK